MKRTPIVAIVLMAVSFGAAPPGTASPASAPAPAPARDRQPPLAGWTSLTLGAQKALFLSARSTLALSESVHEETGRPAIVLKTRSIASVLGAAGFEEETTSYIDRQSRRPIEFFQMRPGDSARRFRFLQDVVRQTTWEPPPDDPRSAFEKWRQVEVVDRKPVFGDGSAPGPQEWLTDFYSLIYLLRDLDLRSAAPASREFTALYRRKLVRIVVTTGDGRRNERQALNEATGETETLKLRERLLTLEPTGDGAGSFRGLLGMQGQTRIWVDQESGALLEIEGEAPGLGPTQVVLTAFRR